MNNIDNTNVTLIDNDIYYDELKDKALKVEIYDRAKDYAKDRNKVQAYFEMGRLLCDAGKEYGKNILKQYSERLTVEVGKKYNERTLRRIRQFYTLFKDQKWSTMWTNLSWSHYREVLPLKDFDEIIFYLNESERQNLSQRQLHDFIISEAYSRLNTATKVKLMTCEKLEVNDLVPNPIIIKSNFLKEHLTEYVLKENILNRLDDFLKQLGIGFSYIGNEYPIKFGNRYNYIDLLLYNVKYKCYVVVELKVTELKKEHTGQIMTYMNYIDDNIKSYDDNETVGIIISKENNEYVIKYCSDKRIISREYKIV